MALTVDGVNSGAPCNDIANGKADGAHKLAAPRPSFTERYLGGRPVLKEKQNYFSFFEILFVAQFFADLSQLQLSNRIKFARNVLLNIV